MSEIFDSRTLSDDFEAALSSSNRIQVQFPSNLAEIDHWVCFRVNKPELMRKDDFPVINDIARIYLPLPASLGTQYSQQYTSEGIGVAGAVGDAQGGGIVSAARQGDIGSLLDRIGTAGKDIAGGSLYYGLQVAEDAAPAVGAAIGDKFGIPGVSAVGGAIAGQFLRGAVAGQGIARNPYMAVMYEQPQFRSHAFSWKFIAKSPQESKALQQIIYLFKYHSSPSMSPTAEHFFEYPEQFDIDFHYSKYLYNIGPSVMTSLDVSYHSEGQPLYFNISDDLTKKVEKAPVSIAINANFQEVAVVSKEGIKQKNGKGR